MLARAVVHVLAHAVIHALAHAEVHVLARAEVHVLACAVVHVLARGTCPVKIAIFRGLGGSPKLNFHWNPPTFVT